MEADINIVEHFNVVQTTQWEQSPRVVTLLLHFEHGAFHGRPSHGPPSYPALKMQSAATPT